MDFYYVQLSSTSEKHKEKLRSVGVMEGITAANLINKINTSFL